jgi:hypothetical protein
MAAAQAITAVAAAIAATGDFAAASAAADAIMDPYLRDEADVALALAFARAGDLARAEQLAADIFGPEQAVLALAGLAVHVAASHPPSVAFRLACAAQEMAADLTDPEEQGHPTARLVEAFIAAGDLDRAEATARSAIDPFWRYMALTTLTEAVGEVGDFDRAQAIADSIGWPHWRAVALTKLFGAYAAAGETARMLRVAATIEGEAVLVQDALLNAYVDAGDATHAEHLARNELNTYRRDSALATVASALARTGNHRCAETAARTITESYPRARALTDVAALAPPERVRPLLAEAVAYAGWTMPLKVIGRHDPETLDQIADLVQ